MTTRDDVLAALDDYVADAVAAQEDEDAQKIADLNAQVADLTQQVNTLEDEIADLENSNTPPPPPPPATTLRFGTYMGQFSADKVASLVGKTPSFSTYYYQVSGTTPATLQVAKHKAEIDKGITQVIDLDYKASTLTMAQVAAGKADAGLTTFLAALKELTDYAKSVHNGAQVWFSFVHEAVVHINGNKFRAGTPTLSDMAAAWNHVMGLAKSKAPDAVRVYWFGGMERNAGGLSFGDMLDPTLIQAVTADPYRFASHPDTETAQKTVGSLVTGIKAKSWAQGKPWGFTEWGSTQSHGDANNAKWITDMVAYLKSQGASIAVYFSRTDGSNVYNIDTGAPLALAAYKAAIK
jgi:hypothetical protein